MGVIVNGSEIILSGTVGDLWFEDGFTASEVISALAEVGHGRDITVRLNSGGGIATEGSAIHAAIALHEGKKTIIVEGIAASAASLIAMAGDIVEMSLGSTMMIHDPSGFTYGTAAEHELSLRALNALGDSFAGIYAKRSGKTSAQCRADMKTEIWLTPEDAVAQGYATRVGPEVANDNVPEEQAVAAFDYRIYAHAPKRLTALATENGWRMASRLPAAPTAPTPTKETLMSEKKPGATSPEDIETARTTAASEATARAQQIVDICGAAGVPTMASKLIGEGVTIEQARARATQAKDIRMVVDRARAKDATIEANAADQFIAEGKSLDQVRAQMFDRFVAIEETTQINSASPLPTPQPGATSATASMQRQLKRAGISSEG